MKFKVIFNIFVIAGLLYGFLAVWTYNQRVNFQKVLTLDTRFTFNANSLKRSELSSPTKIMRHLKQNGISVALDPVMKMSSEYESLGRVLITDYGQIEIYEYEQPKKAVKKLDELLKDEKTEDNSLNLYAYKNLIIVNVSGSGELNEAILGLYYEK